MNTSKITTPLLWRVVIFLSCFVLISGLLGPRIISGGILYRDGFAVYGGLGKAAIFGLIAFMLLIRHRGHELKFSAWRPILLAWAAASLALGVVAWTSVSRLLSDEQTASNIILAHGGLILSVGCAAIASLGPANVRLIWRAYKRELLMATIMAGGFYIFLLSVYALWRPLASIVLVSVHALLSLTNVATVLIPPDTLVTNKFGITVAQYCSGIESIALFSGLYAIVGLLDRERFDLRRYLWVFPVALTLLFALNITRVFILIVAGYYINPEIAFSLFHTYAGMVFFIIYSAAFWAVAYKHFLKRPAEAA